MGTEGPSAGGGPFVVVDWGSTHLRLRLMEDGPGPSSSSGLVAERSSPQGIGAVARGEHQRVFLENLEALLGGGEGRERFQRSGGQVYFAGMVTSSLGWIATPYVMVPAGPREILAGARRESIAGLTLHFLPGVRTADDVMRGEEVEAIGILGSGAGPGGTGEGETTLVLPGTHSKWIRWGGGRILDFVTVITGDLFAGLHQSTLLARTLPSEPAKVAGDLLPDFDRGADLAARLGPLAALFRARSLPVLEALPPPRASALLSGVLIAGEILERTRGAAPELILVAGAPALRDLYLRAIARLGIRAEGVEEELSRGAAAAGWRNLRGGELA